MHIVNYNCVLFSFLTQVVDKEKKGILLEADLNCKILTNLTTNYLFVILYLYNGASSFSSQKFSEYHLFSSRVQTVYLDKSYWYRPIVIYMLHTRSHCWRISGPIKTHGRAPFWILTSQSSACVFTTWRNICKKTWLGRVYFLVVLDDHYWCNYREMGRRHWYNSIFNTYM